MLAWACLLVLAKHLLARSLGRPSMSGISEVDAAPKAVTSGWVLPDIDSAAAIESRRRAITPILSKGGSLCAWKILETVLGSSPAQPLLDSELCASELGRSWTGRKLTCIVQSCREH
jgi:hypothetical protein